MLLIGVYIDHESQDSMTKEYESKMKREHEQITRDKADIEKRLEHEKQEHEKSISDLKRHETDAQIQSVKEQL